MPKPYPVQGGSAIIKSQRDSIHRKWTNQYRDHVGPLACVHDLG